MQNAECRIVVSPLATILIRRLRRHHNSQFSILPLSLRGLLRKPWQSVPNSQFSTLHSPLVIPSVCEESVPPFSICRLRRHIHFAFCILHFAFLNCTCRKAPPASDTPPSHTFRTSPRAVSFANLCPPSQPGAKVSSFSYRNPDILSIPPPN